MKMLGQLKSLLPKGRFAKSVAVLAGGTALGQVLVILASPVITRLYTPDDFGVFAIYASLLGIFLVIAGLRYELAIPLPETDEEAFGLLILTLCIILIFSLALGSFIWLFSDTLITWTKVPSLRPFLWLLPVGVFLAGCYQAFNYWAVRRNAFPVIARTKFNQSLGSVITQVSLGILNLAPIGLVLGQIAGQTVGLGTLARLPWQEMTPSRPHFSWRNLSAVARSYIRFPKYSSGAALLNALGLQLPSLLLASLFSVKVAGLYALSLKVVGVPMVIVASAITQVYFSELASRARTQDDPLMPFFRRTLRNLALLAALIVVLILVGLPWFALIFGQEWARAGLYIALLLPSFYLRFLSGSIVSSLEILGKNDLRLWREILVLVLLLLSLLLAKLLFDSDISAIIGLSLAGIIAYATTLVMVVRTVASNDVARGAA